MCLPRWRTKEAASVAMFSQNMLELALMLLDHDETYQGFVLKFVEHFFWIAAAVDPLGENPDEMWDEEDGFSTTCSVCPTARVRA